MFTYDQVSTAIDGAARLAAQSAIDAFGDDQPGAEVAWDFINEQLYESGEIDRPAALPDYRTHQFEHDYRRHVRNIQRERARAACDLYKKYEGGLTP